MTLSVDEVDEMAPREGVIQFELDFCSDTWMASGANFRELDAWRTLCHRLGLLGQSADRYQGLGFGNVSCRQNRHGFVISGSQTGQAEVLGPDGYALVTDFDVMANRVTARGPVRPSSESLTHGAVYSLHRNIDAVLHVHSPLLWSRAGTLSLPGTPADVAYGTPAMATAVAALYRAEGWSDQGLFVMAGHTDGVLAFGPNTGVAGSLLLVALAQAMAGL